MTASQHAAATLPHALKNHPDSLSVRDLSIQAAFAKLTIGRNGISEKEAYAEYERSVCRENSYAAVVGSPETGLVGPRGFSTMVRAMKSEREAQIICRGRMHPVLH
ncbi:hypothetical protein QTL95_18305 [Rhizobium sp. S152]|uniref:hypothetical protein n=1 Tax=Rhizobium sp. S152 TaxID=3055038 RepID=UPI0025A95F5A|nr:hypothetical protein [Rhizobium sp. S152]MDM9627847.1 hypothetical protein [Rhizobium sp. S152]